jgi:hypothetical protein
MRMSRSPTFTVCPSTTPTWITRPEMSAEMSTFRLGWMTPLAVTTEIRSRVETVSVRTSTPLSRVDAIPTPPTPARAATAITPAMILPRLVMAQRRD